MKINLQLAEAATAHPDGTVSMLRSGIKRAWNPKLPFALIGALVVRVTADLAEVNSEHTVSIRLLNADGKDVMQKIDLKVKYRQAGDTYAICNFRTKFDQYGDYSFAVTVDNIVHDSWPLRVAENSPSI